MERTEKMDNVSFMGRVSRDFAAVWTKPENTALQAYADAVEKLGSLPEDQQTSIYSAAEALLNAHLLGEFPLPLIINEMCRITGKDPNDFLNRGLHFQVEYLQAAFRLFGAIEQ